MSRPPLIPPIGLRLARPARVVTQAFERAMAEAGGSAAAWQGLVLVRRRIGGGGRPTAEAIGITGATPDPSSPRARAPGVLRR